MGLLTRPVRIALTSALVATTVAIAVYAALWASGLEPSAGYNDLINFGDPPGTYYAPCEDGHNAKRSQDSNDRVQFSTKFYGYVPSTYRTAFLNAEEDWDATASKVDITYRASGAAPNFWRTYSFGHVATGFTYTICNHSAGHVTIYSDAYLNRFWLDSMNQLQKQAVASHEEGHQIGLAHAQYSGSIMYPVAPNLVASPQVDDVCGLNAMYRNSTYSVDVPPCHNDHYLLDVAGSALKEVPYGS